MPLSDHTLVLGGASSGKSSFAEALVMATGLSPMYIATAEIRDAEMAQKVAKHRASRGAEWATTETPRDVCSALQSATSKHAVLIDCATLWLTNLMLADEDTDNATDALLDCLAQCPTSVVVVSNEVGTGVIPDNAMARQFCSLQGRFNQRIAACFGSVFMLTAGLPQCLKSPDK